MRWFLLALLLSAPAARAKDQPRAISAAERKRADAIREGLIYLARIRNRDGSFGRTGAGVVGITSLSLLAFLAAGHQPSRGPYGALLADGAGYLLLKSLPPKRKDPLMGPYGKPSGYIYVQGDTDSRMHGHGYATQVLVLAYGAGRSTDARHEELKLKIRRAIRVIENSQTVTGGWGYEPNDTTFHEGSVTVTVVQALRLARDAGFVVSKGVARRGIKYLKDSQKRDGSFKYALAEDRSTPALTAAALTALHGFGAYTGASIHRGLEYLRLRYRHPQIIEWPFYAHYYAAQAFYRAGGADWKAWKKRIVPRMLAERTRTPGGAAYWDDELGRAPSTRGRAYATALRVLALSVEDGYLPLFQK